MMLEIELFEEFGSEAGEDAAHDFEDDEAGSDDDERSEEAAIGEEGKFEEIAGERPEKNDDHDGYDGDEKCRAELVERA